VEHRGEDRHALKNPYADFDPEWLKLLPPDEQAAFLSSLNTLVGGETVTDYIKRIAPTEPPPKHVQPIIDVLEQARIKPVRVCIDMGPGHAKTTTLLRGVAHWLQPDRSPGDLCAYITYSDGQARDKSRVAKEFYEAGGGLLHSDKTADGHWLTPAGGGLVAKGSQGGLMGKRLPGLTIYDDPYKDMEEARSPAINNKVISRFKAVAFTRLQGGSIIVLHTRYAMDDLIGYIMKELKWDHIHVPTVCDVDNDTLGRKRGEVAWPEKYPYEICYESDLKTRKMCSHDGHLEEIEKTLGPHLWHAMYQGKPRPEGQQMFHEPARFKLYPDRDKRTGQIVTPSDFSWKGKRGAIIIDPAATAKTSADWSVLLTVAMEGYGIQAKMWLVDCVRVQVEIPELIKIARRLQKETRLMVACEAVAGFKAVPQSLRAMDPGLRVFDINVSGRDKFTRAMAVAAAWNDGRVVVPVDAPWADTLIEEYTRFTGNGDRHDDQVDAGAHGWNILYRTAPKITSDNYAQNSGM
jgi:predicted phage terminase large subunit-like protein